MHFWHIDPSVEEMCEAMKYIIDTGWLGRSNHLMRKCEYKENGVIKPAVAFVCNAADFDYDELHAHYRYPREYPAVIGKSNCHTFKTESGFIDRTYDGDVFLQLDDGSMAKYSSAKWLTPNDENIEGNGLEPDYEVESINDPDKIDEQVTKALDVLSEM